MTETGNDGLDLPQPAHRLGAGHQPGPQRTGDGGQDDVVDGAAVRLADGAVVGEPGLDADDAALLRQLAGQRVAAGGPATGEPGDHPPAPEVNRSAVRSAESTACRAVSSAVSRSVRLSCSALATQTGRRGAPVRVPLVATEDLDVGVLVEQHLAEVDGLDAVDQRLVGLVEQRDPAVVEPLDEVDLPQRAAAVQRPGDDPGRPARAAARCCPAGAARSGVRGSRCRSGRRRPRPGWPGGREPTARAVGSAARTRSGRGSARRTARSRTPSRVERGPRGRRPRRSRCGAAWSAVSCSRNARSRGRSRSLIHSHRRSSSFGRHGILTEVSGRPCMPSVTIVRA